MGLTLVFAIAILALGANGKGLSTKLAEKPVCDGQQLACTYCLDTVTLLQGSVNDAGVESAVVKFMLVICDFINSTSAGKQECIKYINTFPARAEAASNSIFADPQTLCGFVCKARGPVGDHCQLAPTPKVEECPVTVRSDNIACEVCKSVPIFIKQILGGDGFLELLENYLLINCDLIAPGCAKDICVSHTKFLSVKIKFVVDELMSPDRGCAFICDV
ncbi:uncharacterized protein [Asterias amurensis]|uniref:uncharacterized protein n=1 Tax=Asterias amurensis TaxID=7602 RepID=UPI003AB35BA3